MGKDEKLKEAIDTLEKGIGGLYESERYKNYLRTMAKFHDYSFSNCMLIFLQKPDASHVAGFKTWQNVFNRNVKKGECGIIIIAPSPYKRVLETEVEDENGDKTTETVAKKYMSYHTTHVFDISQTEGEPLPEIAVRLDNDVEDYIQFLDALLNVAAVPVSFENIGGASNGYYDLEKKEIVVKSGMSEAQTVKTTLHEIAHSMLHNLPDKTDVEDVRRKSNRTREVESESIAYAVCSHYGIDTSDYSFGYVAAWSSGKELPELKASLETIRETASTLINAIDTELDKLAESGQVYESAQNEAYHGTKMQM